MSFELEGKLVEKFETVDVSDSFRKREFVLESTTKGKDEEVYSELIKFQAIQDRCDILDSIKIDSNVKVFFNVKGRKWSNPETKKVSYFNNLDAWRIESTNEGSSKESSDTKSEKDDLPF